MEQLYPAKARAGGKHAALIVFNFQTSTIVLEYYLSSSDDQTRHSVHGGLVVAPAASLLASLILDGVKDPLSGQGQAANLELPHSCGRPHGKCKGPMRALPPPYIPHTCAWTLDF